MQTSTHTLPLAATKAAAFAFLADIQNLPKWATQFCRSLRRDPEGRWIVETPHGEILFRIAADPETGVIDMFGGVSESEMAYWPARVVERPGHGSLFIFTALQYPGVSDAAFKAQCEGLAHEFPQIERHVGRDPGTPIG